MTDPETTGSIFGRCAEPCAVWVMHYFGVWNSILHAVLFAFMLLWVFFYKLPI